MTVHANTQLDDTLVLDTEPEMSSQRPALDAEEPSASETTTWEVAEEFIEQRLGAHTGPVLVDLDETLYLRNSTEEFINLAVPGLLAAYLLRLLDIAAPWRWSGGPKCRDNWRVALVLLLFPWTYFRWQHHCQERVPAAINHPLRAALQQRPGPLVIASNGYGILIRPMLGAFDLPQATLVCCHLGRFNHRRDGKLALLDNIHDRAFIAQSLVITDSRADADLLAVCKTPCLTVWKDAVFKRAFDGLAYLPGDYLSRVKRPRQGALRHLVLYNLLPWILVGLSTSPAVIEVLGLGALFLSLWSIYELGYYDNDRCAIRYEKTPKLTPEALTFNARFFGLKTWATALVLGAAGISLLQPANFLGTFVLWAAALLALYGIYRFYNRIDKSSRVWVYPLLQMFRYGGLFVVVTGSPVGYAAALSQIMSHWVGYIIYRYQRTTGVTGWPKVAIHTIQLFIFVLLAIPLLLTQQWHAFLSPASACLVIFVYGVWKYELKKHLDTFHRLDRKRSAAED